MKNWWFSSVSSKLSAIGWVCASKISLKVLNWAKILCHESIFIRLGETTNRRSQAQLRSSSAKPVFWASRARVKSINTERPKNTSSTKARCRKIDWNKKLKNRICIWRMNARFWSYLSSKSKNNFRHLNLLKPMKKAKTKCIRSFKELLKIRQFMMHLSGMSTWSLLIKTTPKFYAQVRRLVFCKKTNQLNQNHNRLLKMFWRNRLRKCLLKRLQRVTTQRFMSITLSKR